MDKRAKINIPVRVRSVGARNMSTEEEGEVATSAHTQDTEADYLPPKRQTDRWASSSRDETVTLHIPKGELLKATSDASVRCKLSHRQAVAVTASIVKAGGGSLNDVTLSKSSSHRHRKSEINDSYEQILASFKASTPQYIVLHWDAKQVKYAHHKRTEERLAIVASLPGDQRPAQFLGAPQLPDGSGASIKVAVQATIQEWGIPASHVIGLSWDTTSSNTGSVKGSSLLVERELGGARLWLACRHHIGELHVKHVDHEISGATTGKFHGFNNDNLQLKKPVFSRLLPVPCRFRQSPFSLAIPC